MHGQWLGQIDGDNKGHITLNLEKVGEKIKGIAIFYDHNINFPSLISEVEIKNNENGYICADLTNFLTINPTNCLIDNMDNFKKKLSRNYSS